MASKAAVKAENKLVIVVVKVAAAKLVVAAKVVEAKAAVAAALVAAIASNYVGASVRRPIRFQN